ncbi:hypothetical protein BK816_04395 [Boudabousia tangfeifanii]|uniref:SAM-dependent MTase RsmB/NOP-type domain-containing protein n=1 Tax=Boudabousia tangfeifanii TaxID=1912795 RepID=A0A1D9MMF7_9ACTO|nr:hypothetical protein BK816_04395 [Boudabousia tangfeifanii]
MAALDVLVQVREDEAYANLILDRTLKAYEVTGRDAAFATELAYGTLRLQGFYDAVIELCTPKPLSTIDGLVLDILRLGAHQILSMRVPAHAAVAQTVDMARQTASAGPAKFVNAILRRITERSLEQWQRAIQDPSDQEQSVANLTSHPKWMVSEFSKALAEGDRSDLAGALAANNIPPKVTLAARPGLTTAEKLLAQTKDLAATPGALAPTAVVLGKGDPRRIEAVVNRQAAVADEASQLVAMALAKVEIAGEDLRWLDLCAGPGGKAGMLAGFAKQQGASLVANELHEHRAKLVANTLAPFGPSIAKVHVGDGVEFGKSEYCEGKFDRVLVDAPCSGLGALRRRPEARWRKSLTDIPPLHELQTELLAAAVTALRPGGVVGYVTCSPVLAETKEVVEWALANLPLERAALTGDIAKLLAPMKLSSGDYQFWPDRDGTDALFLSLLRKREEA